MLSSSEIAELRGAELTYAEVAGTRGDLPPGYRHVRRSRVVAMGEAGLTAAASILLGWEMHRRASLSLRASRATVADGAVAVLRLGWGPVAVTAPVRVVYTVDEPHRRGFAYGTLPGHPESGEEAFVVELGEDGQVRVHITAFSRPASTLARAAGPVSHRVQDWVTSRYLRGF
jgi:uncharacterized protein (UPF0548 family)